MRSPAAHVPGFSQLLKHRAAHAADLPAVISADQSLSYRELFDFASRVATRLSANGISPGQRVALYTHNRWESVVILYGLWLSGITAIPLSTRFPARVLPRYLQDLDVSLLLAEKKLAAGINFRTTLSIEDFIAESRRLKDGISIEEEGLEINPQLTIILTSGTSGTPKAVVHRWSHHYFSARGSNENLPFKAGERWLLSLPLYHIGGVAILFRALLGGATVVIGDPGKIALEVVSSLQITHLSMVALQLQRFIEVYQQSNLRLPLKAILLGGGPVPPQIIEQGYNLNLPLFTSYGSTEMASQITATQPGAPLRHLLTSGKPLPYREVRISDNDEILVRGLTLFEGYWKNGKVHPQVDEEGWFHTGDVGKWTVEGYLKVIGRRDNMFISGGENIHPEEIELCLLRHPQVDQAVVVDVPNATYGARPVAFVRLKSGDAVNYQEVRTFLEGFLPRFKLPDHFFALPEEERNKIKPSRKKLREYALQMLQKNNEL